MAELMRKQLLDSLEGDWGSLAARFQALAPGEQETWLAQQGYGRLADLLAHVIAWWDEAYAAASRLVDGEAVTHKEYNVDGFNREAVQRFADLDEASVVAAFAARRERWATLVAELPETALADAHLVRVLSVDLIDHYREHALAGG
jgi:hypothetical protein